MNLPYKRLIVDMVDPDFIEELEATEEIPVQSGLGKLIKKTTKAAKYALGIAAVTSSLFASCLAFEQSTGYVQRRVGETVHIATTATASAGMFDNQIRKLELEPLEKIVDKFEERKKIGGSIIVVDRNHDPISEVRNYSHSVPYSFISPKIISAVKAAEDMRFDYHFGWDIGSLSTAVLSNISKKLAGSNGHPRGASTLSIQLADIIHEDDKKGGRKDWGKTKVKEFLYAPLLEQHFTKEEILTHYLNLAYFGYSKDDKQHLVGIEAASEHYFGKSCAEVDWFEAATLVSMVKAPTVMGTKARSDWINGDTSSKSVKRLIKRAAYVIENLPLVDDSFKEKDHDIAKKRLNYSQFNFYQNHGESLADSFLSEVLSRQEVINRNSEKLPNRTIIYTTLDSQLQKFVQENFFETVKGIREKANFPNPELLNGSVIVVDTQTQEVLAMVGGLGKGEGDFLNRATRKYVIPGSSFKPLVLAAALHGNVIPSIDEKFHDIETTFLVPGHDKEVLYTPQNFSKKWTGAHMKMYHALVYSKNGIFVQLNEKAITKLGDDGMKNFFGQLGIDMPAYHLSSVLGVAETSLMDLAGVYMTFPNDGKVNTYSTGDKNLKLLKGVNHDGSFELVTLDQQSLVFSSTVAYQIDKALTDVVATGTARRAKIPGYKVRGKTGTSPRSFLFAGYEPVSHTLAIAYFASDDPSKTGEFSKKYTGGKFGAPLVKKIIQYRMEK